MRILLLFLAFLFAAASISSRAEAQYYPWCAIYSGLGPGASCGYATFAQCMASVRGLGGFASKSATRANLPNKVFDWEKFTGTLSGASLTSSRWRNPPSALPARFGQVLSGAL